MTTSSLTMGAEFTPYGAVACNESDSEVDVYVSAEYFEPRIIYVKEGDKVCLKVIAVDEPISFTIDSYPVMLSARPTANKKPTLAYFRATKVGEFRIRCKGGCAYKSEPKLVVQSKASFEKWEEEKYREEAQRSRMKVKPKTERREYIPMDDRGKEPAPRNFEEYQQMKRRNGG